MTQREEFGQAVTTVGSYLMQQCMRLMEENIAHSTQLATHCMHFNLSHCGDCRMALSQLRKNTAEIKHLNTMQSTLDKYADQS